MDVVRRNIETLHGKVEIDSKIGEGTVFSIHLPLTLAIIAGMLVRVGGQQFILPTLNVRESLSVSPEMVTRLHGRGELVDVRGQLIPLQRLYQSFGLDPVHAEPADGIVPVLDLRMIFDLPDTTITDKTCTVVIQVPTATGRLTTIGLMVDRVTEVVLVEDEQIEKPSDFGEQRESGRDFAVARINGVIVSLIDLSQVLHQELSAIT